MQEFVFEFVESAPTDTIVELYQAGRWWREDPAWRAAIPQMIRGSFCFLLAREPGGRIVGMGRVISDGVSDAYIQDVTVLDGFRNRGVGKRIIAEIVGCLRRRGVDWIGLIAEPGSLAFYRGLGFGAMRRCVPMRWRGR